MSDDIVILVFWGLFVLGTAQIARSHDRSGLVWFLLGLLLGPLALLTIYFVVRGDGAPPRRAGSASRPEAASDDVWTPCPYCYGTNEWQCPSCSNLRGADCPACAGLRRQCEHPEYH